MAKSYKNTILPEIKLKYFKRPDLKSPNCPRTNFTCAKCEMKNIPFIGSMDDAYSSNPKYFCEDCAIDAYMATYGFISREAAVSWRRRIFDVGYFLNETLLECYAKEKNMAVNDLSEEEWWKVCNLGNNFYNKVPKRKKEWLEAVPTQKELEENLQKLCRKIKF